jgi:DHA1 family multidrug resistance protein-like MFS transporter
MNRNLALIAASLFTWGIGEGLFIYFQPLYLQEWGADPLLIGGVLGAMGVAMAISQIPAGYLSDKVGSRSIMWTSWILGTIAAWVMALANSLPFFVTGMILYGMTGFVVAPMNSYITTVRGKYSIGRALTFVSGMYNLGAVLGPITGGLMADKFGLKTVYMVAGVLFIASTIIVLFVKKNPQPHHADQNSTQTKGLFKNLRFLSFLGITFVTMFTLFLPQTFAPSFLQNQQHFTRTTIGILGAFGSLGNAVAVLALGSLNSVAGFIIGQVWVLLFALLFLNGGSPFWFGLGYFFLGGLRLCRSMVLAIGRTLVHPEETGFAYGMMETASSIAIIAAPILAGILYRADPYAIFRLPIFLILGVIILNLVVFRIIKKKRSQNAAST